MAESLEQVAVPEPLLPPQAADDGAVCIEAAGLCAGLGVVFALAIFFLNIPGSAHPALPALDRQAGAAAELARVGGFLAYRGYVGLTLAVSAAVLAVSAIAVGAFVKDRSARRTAWWLLAAGTVAAAAMTVWGGSVMAGAAAEMICAEPAKAAAAAAAVPTAAATAKGAATADAAAATAAAPAVTSNAPAAAAAAPGPWDYCGLGSDAASLWIGRSANVLGSAATVAVLFAIFVVAGARGPGTAPAMIGSRERCVTVLLVAASALLVSALLLDKGFLRWIFAGELAMKEPPGAVLAYVGGTATFNGAVETALLGLTWLIAIVLLQRRGAGGAGAGAADPLASGLSLYNLSAIAAPVLAAIASNFFPR
jgi:hypothetical protein